jgi:hypothetical protein
MSTDQTILFALLFGLGLPLEILIVLVAIPTILVVWPL